MALLFTLRVHAKLTLYWGVHKYELLFLKKKTPCILLFPEDEKLQSLSRVLHLRCCATWVAEQQIAAKGLLGKIILYNPLLEEIQNSSKKKIKAIQKSSRVYFQADNIGI